MMLDFKCVGMCDSLPTRLKSVWLDNYILNKKKGR